MILLLAFVAAVALVAPNLGRYPWAAPDEVHHLIVARNLAQYGAYASGHPDTGMIYFDPYDSVGPATILPIAAMFAAAGPSVVAARVVIAAAYLVLCGLVYVVMRRPFGPTSAALATLMMSLAFGSVYLGRSLYGEVPALMFLMAGLALWGRSIRAERPGPVAFAAGLAFGLAVLSKSFILIGAWAFAGAWLYDRVTFRAIRPAHVLWPAAGMLAILSAWSGVQFVYRDLVTDDISMVLYYRHYLMFGLDTLAHRYPELLKAGLPALAATAAFVFVLPAVFRDRYDPPAVVLYLLAIFFAFWWLFFTPGVIPRYLWYSCAIAAMFAGPLLVTAARRIARLRHDRTGAWAYALAGVLIIGTGLYRTAFQVERVYRSDETQAERMLADFVKSLPPEATLATTYWPVERSMNFMAERHLAVVDPADDATGDFDVVIYSEKMPGVPESVRLRGRRMGHYVVLADSGIPGSKR